MNDYSWDTTKADLSSGFDANDRVINWERENGDKQGWDLDLIGNWGNTTGTLDGNAFDEDRDHNDVNEVTDIDGNSVVYDAKGNMTNDAWLNSLSWDIDNHLQSHNSVTFTYDALGRRLEKKTTTGNTLFICNGQRVVEEYADDLVNGYQLARSYVYGSYIDDVVAKIEGGSTHYYHTDRQFNVRGITDSTGAVVELYAYSVYGKQTVMDSAGTVQVGSAVNNFYGYTGRYLDSETGLWYFRARYFSDEMGRFINRDPLGYVDGMSLYNGYFAERFMVDPTGTKIVVDDTEEYNEIVKKILEKIKNCGDEDIKKMIEELEKSEYKHYIRSYNRKNRPYNRTEGTRENESNGKGTGSTTFFEHDKKVGGLSPESILVHELKHGSDKDKGVIEKDRSTDKDGNGTNDSEDRAMKAGNKYRKTQNEKNRDNYKLHK